MLGDKDARITMRGVITDQLLNPARMREIAGQVDGFSKSLGSRSAAQAKANAAIDLMHKEWQPAGRFAVALAAPAVKAAGHKLADVLVPMIWIRLYDTGLNPLTTLMASAFAGMQSACAAGDVFSQWACSIGTAVIRWAWDEEVDLGRDIGMAVAKAVAKGAVDIAVDKAAPEAANFADSKADPKLTALANKFVPGPVQEKVRGFTEKVMKDIAGKEVEAVLASTKLYNDSVSNTMRACTALAR